MSFLGLVVLVVALVPLLTRGSYRRLAEAPWRCGGLLALGIGLQLLLDTGLVPRSSWHSVGFGILVASYVVLIGFCAGNLIIRGMAVVLVGVALNAFIVTIDQGMPVRVPADWQSSANSVDITVKHHPRVDGDHLLSLTDIIVLRKLDAVISFGDLIIAFGLVDVTYWASRKSRRTRRGVAGKPLDPIAGPPEPPTNDTDTDADAGTDEADVDTAPSSTRPARGPRQPVSVGIGSGTRGERDANARAKSAPPRSRTADEAGAIQDALERLERP